ncbi:retrotransposon ORF1 [Tanacetum coccineum]
MDSSMGKMCLGKDVTEISSDQNEGLGDCDSPEYKYTVGSRGKKALEALVFHKMDTEGDSDRDEEGNPNLNNLETLLDFDFDEEPQTESDLPPLVCKIGKGSRNKKKVMENIMYFNNGVGPSSSVGTPLTQEEAEKRALAYNISMRYEILEEVRPVIETLAYNDKYRKLLDEIWADKVRLDGKIKPEEERVMAKVKGQMLKEKKDPGEFIFPIRPEGLINENALADTGSATNTMPYRIYEELGRDDIMKEDRNIKMINYTEAEVTGQLVNVLCQVGFTTLSAKFLILEIHVDRDAPIMTSGAYDHKAGSSHAKRFRNVETIKQELLPDVHHELLHKIGCGEEIDNMLKISLKEAESGEEIFFFVGWVRAFNIREPIYLELCREFYATYEFDEVCVDDELQSKKIISFRLGGRAHSLTLLEFARRLGLYHVEELEEEGFDTYFQGGLRSDENFNAREY